MTKTICVKAVPTLKYPSASLKKLHRSMLSAKSAVNAHCKTEGHINSKISNELKAMEIERGDAFNKACRALQIEHKDRFEKTLKALRKESAEAQYRFYDQLFDEMMRGLAQGFSFIYPDREHRSRDSFVIPEMVPEANNNLKPQLELNAENNTYKLPVTCCVKSKSISIGAFVSQRPHIHFTPETEYEIKNAIFKANGLMPLIVSDPLSDFYVFNRIYSRVITPQFNNYFRLLNYRIWVGDDKELIKRFCRDAGRITNGYVAVFHQYRSFIMKAVANNEHQLIPAIMFFGVDVGDLKKGLGVLWKGIYHNSPSRNHLIFGHLRRLSAHDDDACTKGVNFTSANSFIVESNSFDDNIKKLTLLQSMPSSILKRHWLFKDVSNVDQEYLVRYLSMLVWTGNILKGKKKTTDYEAVKDHFGIVRDTQRMASRLQLPFSLNWSYRRMVREHRNYTLEYHKSKSDYFEYDFKYPWPAIIQCDDAITARLIISNAMLFLEGEQMHHCVGSYHDDVLSGQSVIYSLIDTNNEDRSTLEIGFRGTGKRKTAYCAQHKSKWNSHVEESFNSAAEFCINMINDVLRENR